MLRGWFSEEGLVPDSHSGGSTPDTDSTGKLTGNFLWAWYVWIPSCCRCSGQRNRVAARLALAHCESAAVTSTSYSFAVTMETVLSSVRLLSPGPTRPQSRWGAREMHRLLPCVFAVMGSASCPGAGAGLSIWAARACQWLLTATAADTRIRMPPLCLLQPPVRQSAIGDSTDFANLRRVPVPRKVEGGRNILCEANPRAVLS